MCVYIYSNFKGHFEIKFTLKLKPRWVTLKYPYLQLRPRATRVCAWAMWCRWGGRYGSNLQFGYTRQLGDKHSMFVCLWWMPGGLWSDNLPSAAPALWIHRASLRPSPGAKLGPHNRPPQQKDGHGGSGTRKRTKKHVGREERGGKLGRAQKMQPTRCWGGPTGFSVVFQGLLWETLLSSLFTGWPGSSFGMSAGGVLSLKIPRTQPRELSACEAVSSWRRIWCGLQN